MIQKQISPSVGICIGRISYVVAIPFQKPDHRIFRIEQPVFRNAAAAAAIAGNKWPVVTHFGSFAAAAGVQTFSVVVVAVNIVGLPRGIGSLEKQVGITGVVAHYKYNVAGSVIIGSG